MKAIDGIAAIVWALCLAALLGGGVSPLIPVDSPFPSNGSWLYVVSEANDLSGAEVAANADDIRAAVENWRIADYQANPAPEWVAAHDLANDKGNGKPFFVFRSGLRASQGELAGTVVDMHNTLRAAVGAK